MLCCKLYYDVYGVDCIPPHASEDDARHVFLTARIQMHRQHVPCNDIAHSISHATITLNVVIAFWK